MDSRVRLAGLISRRSFLASAAVMLMATASARALTISQGLPWNSSSSTPPLQVLPGPWQYFTWQEASLVEAIVDRLIPADGRGVGGREAGCAVFIDRQLAGAYGTAAGAYMEAPFDNGTASQGFQRDASPARRYREGLKALSTHIEKTYPGKTFGVLSATDQDTVLTGLETGKIVLEGADAADFFALILQNTTEGFFADPVYGGNREMAGWKLLGFPGARYDYRDWIDRHNEPFPLPPTGIMGRPDWSAR